jgi:hypothetical protein
MTAIVRLFHGDPSATPTLAAAVSFTVARPTAERAARAGPAFQESRGATYIGAARALASLSIVFRAAGVLAQAAYAGALHFAGTAAAARDSFVLVADAIHLLAVSDAVAASVAVATSNEWPDMPPARAAACVASLGEGVLACTVTALARSSAAALTAAAAAFVAARPGDDHTGAEETLAVALDAAAPDLLYNLPPSFIPVDLAAAVNTASHATRTSFLSHLSLNSWGGPDWLPGPPAAPALQPAAVGAGAGAARPAAALQVPGPLRLRVSRDLAAALSAPGPAPSYRDPSVLASALPSFPGGSVLCLASLLDACKFPACARHHCPLATLATQAKIALAASLAPFK